VQTHAVGTNNTPKTPVKAEAEEETNAITEVAEEEEATNAITVDLSANFHGMCALFGQPEELQEENHMNAFRTWVNSAKIGLNVRHTSGALVNLVAKYGKKTSLIAEQFNAGVKFDCINTTVTFGIHRSLNTNLNRILFAKTLRGSLQVMNSNYGYFSQYGSEVNFNASAGVNESHSGLQIEYGSEKTENSLFAAAGASVGGLKPGDIRSQFSLEAMAGMNQRLDDVSLKAMVTLAHNNLDKGNTEDEQNSSELQNPTTFSIGAIAEYSISDSSKAALALKYIHNNSYTDYKKHEEGDDVLKQADCAFVGLGYNQGDFTANAGYEFAFTGKNILHIMTLCLAYQIVEQASIQLSGTYSMHKPEELYGTDNNEGSYMIALGLVVDLKA